MNTENCVICVESETRSRDWVGAITQNIINCNWNWWWMNNIIIFYYYKLKFVLLLILDITIKIIMVKLK